MPEKETAVLILENGMRFEGRAFGYTGRAAGEVIFTTGMSGYQETLTDPAYAGQIVVMTYPLIGNAGINLEDMESDAPRLSALIVREKCDMPSNWRNEMSLDGFLRQHKIVGLEGIDTRALTKLLRDAGALKGVITAEPGADQADAAQMLAGYSSGGMVARVTTQQTYRLDGEGDASVLPGKHIAVIDLGTKQSMLTALRRSGHRLTVFPAFTEADEILSAEPDAIFLTSGPGDPKDLPQIVETVQTLSRTKPVFGVCLGMQVLGLALGCDTSRMPFGHHGSNYPAKSIDTGRIYITSQSHEHVLSALSSDVEALFTNVNDGTVEGIRHRTLPLAGVQFYPEASPGPNDTSFLLHDFYKNI